MCMAGGESLQSFIPLTCGGGRANAVDEVGRVAVTASEAWIEVVVPPLVALSCCCCGWGWPPRTPRGFLCFRCFLRDVFLLSLHSTRTNSAKFKRTLYIYIMAARGNSLLELWVTTFLPDRQSPLIFVRFISNFLCMCSNIMWFWSKSDKH